MSIKESRDIDILKVVWSARWKILLFSLVVSTTSYFATLLIPQQFIAKSTILIAPPRFNTNKKADFLSVEDYKRLTLSYGMLQAVIDKLEPKYPDYEGMLYPEVLKGIINLDSMTEERYAAKTSRGVLVTVNTRGTDRVFITDLANTLVDLLIKKSENMRGTENETMVREVKSRYMTNLEALQSAEDLLHKTKSSNHQESAELNLEVKRTYLKQHEVILMKTEIDLVDYESQVFSLFPNNSGKESLTGNYSKVQSKYDSSAAKRKLLQVTIGKIKEDIRILENNIFKMRLEEKQLQRKVALLNNNNGVLTNRMEKIVLYESEKSSDIKLLSMANQPNIPVGPNRLKLTLIAAASSFFLGLIVACSKEHLGELS